MIYNFNASSRYPMGVGEKHVLFVTLDDDGFWVNSCGNSSPYERATKTLQELKRLKKNQ
jgi:hypothetical protein